MQRDCDQRSPIEKSNQRPQERGYLRFRGRCSLVFLYCYLLVSFFSAPILAADFSSNGQRWMTDTLPDSMPLSILSIPGTHDSAAYNTGIIWARTQDDSITEQLNKGVRYLDLRVGKDAYMYHGSIWVGANEGLVTHLKEIKTFLNQNPGEFVLIRIKAENITFKTAEDYLNYRKNILLAFANSGLADDFYKGDSPTVKDIRGKVLLLDDTSVLDDFQFYNYSLANTQDNYEGVDRKQKYEAIIQKVIEANTLARRLTINYLSYTAGLATPRKLAGEMNPDVDSWIKTNQDKYPILGVMPMDFPTTSLIEAIASSNIKLAPAYRTLDDINSQLATLQAGVDTNHDAIITVDEAQHYNQLIEATEDLEKRLKEEQETLPSPVAIKRLEQAIAALPALPEKVTPTPIADMTLTQEETSLEKQVAAVEKIFASMQTQYQSKLATGLLSNTEVTNLQSRIRGVQMVSNTVSKAVQRTTKARDFLKAIWLERLTKVIDALPEYTLKEMILSLQLPTNTMVYNGTLPQWDQNTVMLTYADADGKDPSQAVPNVTTDDFQLVNPDGTSADTSGKVGAYTLQLSQEGINKYAQLATEKGLYLNSDHLPKETYTITARPIKIKLLPQSIEQGKTPTSGARAYEWLEEDPVLQADLSNGRAQLIVDLSQSYQGKTLVANHTYSNALELALTGETASNYKWDATAVRTADLTVLPQEVVNTKLYFPTKPLGVLFALAIGGLIIAFSWFVRYR